MELRLKVHGSMDVVPHIEFNYGSVYIRFNVRRVQETIQVPDESGQMVDQTIELWEYDEWFMSDYEYQQVQQGYMPYNGHWDEQLRSVEREYLYIKADERIMRLMTYAPDEAMKAKWIQYKREVHDSINQPEYPRNVTYPVKPE